MAGLIDRLPEARAAIFDALVFACEKLTPGAPSGAEPVVDAWVLPPYPGEMGHEVRSFIGRVEPYLRQGWKILARRPALYPAGAAIFDEAYFAKEGQLFRDYNVRRWSHSVLLPSRSPWMHVQFRRRWRKLFAPYLLAPDRPLTEWDSLNFSTRARYNRLIDFVSILPPSYLPISEIAASTGAAHVGVQMRHMKTATNRNSDVKFMLSAADELGRAWGLPVLVYGHAEGSYLPEGYRCTFHAGDRDLLGLELSHLRSCRLMLAPDSGWTDIMAWLGIPTIVERELYPDTFYRWRRYGARIRIFDPSVSLLQQASELLGEPAANADCGRTPTTPGSESALLAAKASWVSRGV